MLSVAFGSVFAARHKILGVCLPEEVYCQYNPTVHSTSLRFRFGDAAFILVKEIIGQVLTGHYCCSHFL
jgi:hypothetical protein